MITKLKWKNVKLEYYVFDFDFNSDKLKYMNVLKDEGLIEELHTKYKKKLIYDYVSLRQALHSYFVYRYMSKAECELYMSPLFVKDDKDFYKIDIFTQLLINFDIIIDIINKGIGFNYEKPKKDNFDKDRLIYIEKEN